MPNIKAMELRQNPLGEAVITLVLDVPPSEMSEVNRKVADGKAYTVSIKPLRKGKTLDQNNAIWGKVTEIADALYASKEEIYEIILRRYGQGVRMRIPAEDLADIQRTYRLVDIVQKRDEDGTIFLHAYKGLSQMDSAEASRILEGCLSECKEIGISAEIRDE